MLSEGLKAEEKETEAWNQPTRRVQPDPVLSLSPWRESELLKAQERQLPKLSLAKRALVAIFLSMTLPCYEWLSFYSLFRGKSSKKHTDKAVPDKEESSPEIVE